MRRVAGPISRPGDSDTWSPGPVRARGIGSLCFRAARVGTAPQPNNGLSCPHRCCPHRCRPPVSTHGRQDSARVELLSAGLRKRGSDSPHEPVPRSFVRARAITGTQPRWESVSPCPSRRRTANQYPPRGAANRRRSLPSEPSLGAPLARYWHGRRRRNRSTTNQVTIPTRATIRYERVSMAIALAFFVVAIVLSVPAFSGVGSYSGVDRPNRLRMISPFTPPSAWLPALLCR